MWGQLSGHSVQLLLLREALLRQLLSSDTCLTWLP